MAKFRIIGISEPGRINAKLNGRFTDINLHTAPEDVLEKLYADGCPFVQLTPEEFMERNPDIKNIDIKPIRVNRKK